jgi:hypothetical protein
MSQEAQGPQGQPGQAPEPVAEQAQQQTGQQQVRVRVDERQMNTTYANAFRTNGTAEEVMLDFGLNLVTPSQQEGQNPDILFQVTDRIILNYYSAKRLAVTLSRLIRQHEEQFGELELDPQKRRTS